MATALVRINGGEVLKISLPVTARPNRPAKPHQLFTDRDTNYFEVLVDPPRPDGDDVRDMSGGVDGKPGPFRVLGFAKVFRVGIIRDATQPEIDDFAVRQEDDEQDQGAADARSLIEETRINPGSRFRKSLKALAMVTMEEINILRVAAGLPPRTKAQMLAAVAAKVDRDD